MFTQCPQCLTVYEPSAAQLAAGRGQLRCGVCETVFDALERLSEAPIHLRAQVRASAAPAPGDIPRVGVAEIPSQGDLFQAGAGEPGFLRRRASLAREDGGSARWWTVAVALTLVLLLQVALAQRDQLAADPRWRPYVAPLVRALGFELTPWRAPESVSLTSRDVRQHPSVPDALMITATLRNDSSYPIAWPVLELKLADFNGELLGLRRFRVEEYLGAPPQQPHLAPGQSVAATLELADPGKRAIAFEFDFL